MTISIVPSMKWHELLIICNFIFFNGILDPLKKDRIWKNKINQIVCVHDMILDNVSRGSSINDTHHPSDYDIQWVNEN